MKRAKREYCIKYNTSSDIRKKEARMLHSVQQFFLIAAKMGEIRTSFATNLT